MVRSTPAETVTKSFEIGPGTSQPRSHFRTFQIPCGVRMAASITYSREGPAGQENDVPIFVEVRKPAATAEEDGPVAAVKENLTATRTPKTTTLTAAVSDRGGCSIPWRVRVKHDADGPVPNKVSGNITVSFALAATHINVEGGAFRVARESSVTKNLGNSQGIRQGTIVITGTWKMEIASGSGIQGPNPVKLQFRLIDPQGVSVAFAEGYSGDELRDLPKLRLTYQVADCVSGQWKLKVTGTNADGMDINVTVRLTPGC